jgi:two-component system cell cycle sensor histidine kinase/response regulator CckA
MLSSLGYQVVVAGDGLEALGLLDGGLAIDVLVTDVVMPRLSGPDLVARLRGPYPTLPVLFVSGYADVTAGRLDLPRTRFLAKPFSVGALADTLRALLDPVAAVEPPGPTASPSGS